MDACTEANQPASDEQKIVLAVDIGGSHVKIRTSSGGEERKFTSGAGMGPARMMAQLKVRGYVWLVAA